MSDLQRLARAASEMQAEIDAARMGDPLKREIERLNVELEAVCIDRDAQVDEVVRLRAIEQAARNLDAHRDEGYATLVSYLIRLHEALDAHDGQPALSES